MDLLILPNGTIRAIYAEDIDLVSLGRTVIRRASHVEPDQDGRWIADLTPVFGPIFGPFDRRSDAIQAELAWLKANWLTRSTRLTFVSSL
jgi:hypothetical protein